MKIHTDSPLRKIEFLPVVAFCLCCGCATPERVVAPPQMPRSPVGNLQLVTKELPHCSVSPDIQWNEVFFSPDVCRVAYVVRRSGKQMVVVDGQEGRAYQQVNTRPGRYDRPNPFSPDAKRVAYAAKADDRWVAVVDGVEGPAYDQVRAPVFSPDSRRVAYAARRQGKWVVVVDGKESEEYDRIGAVIFSPDSKRIAYAAARIVRQDKKRLGMLLVDEITEEHFVVVDGVRSAGHPFSFTKGYTEVSLGYLAFSTDSQQLLYLMAGKVSILVLDGQTILEQETPSPPAVGSLDQIVYAGFVPHSHRLALCVERKNKLSLMIDGVKVPEDDRSGVIPSVLTASGWPSSRTAATGAWVEIDGTEMQEYVRYNQIMNALDIASIMATYGGPSSMVNNGPLQPPTFSPDGLRYFYPVRFGDKYYVVVDGQISEGYDALFRNICFSPDSKHVGYIAQRAGKLIVVVDGVESSPIRVPNVHVALLAWEKPPIPLAFDSPTSLHTLVFQKDRVVRVDIQVAEK